MNARQIAAEIAGPDGWWHRSNGEQVEAAAERLITLGVSPGDTLDVLLSVVGAIADEYGS